MDMNLARAPLQAVALLTGDGAASQALFAFLGETQAEAAIALAGSPWGASVNMGLGLLGLEMALMVCPPLIPDGSPARYQIRAMALMTNDAPTRAALLQILGESELQARTELENSCWADAVADPKYERHRLALELGANQ